MSNWLVLVVDSRNEVQTRRTPKGKEEELSKLFDLNQDADRWACRKLVDCGSDCIAIIQHTRSMGKNGEPLTLKITRDEAMGKLFPHKKGPAVRVTKSKRATSFYQMKVGQTRIEFSRG